MQDAGASAARLSLRRGYDETHKNTEKSSTNGLVYCAETTTNTTQQGRLFWHKTPWLQRRHRSRVRPPARFALNLWKSRGSRPTETGREVPDCQGSPFLIIEKS